MILVKVWKIGNMTVCRVNISISKTMYKWVQDHHISLSKFVRAKLEEEMRKKP